MFLSRERKAGLRVFRKHHVEALVFKIHFEKPQDVGIVIDDFDEVAFAIIFPQRNIFELRFRFMDRRKSQGEAGSFSDFAGNHDFAFMGINNGFCDR